MAITVLLESKGVEHSALAIDEQSIREGLETLIDKSTTAFSQGVFGVPTFVCDGRLYFGAHRIELLASLLP